MKAYSIEGNRQWLDGGAMFGNAPRPLWERWAKPDALGRIPLACRCMLIEIDDVVARETYHGTHATAPQWRAHGPLKLTMRSWQRRRSLGYPGAGHEHLERGGRVASHYILVVLRQWSFINVSSRRLSRHSENGREDCAPLALSGPHRDDGLATGDSDHPQT